MTPPAAPTTIPTRCDLLEPKFDVELDELLDGKLEDGVELDGTLEDVEEEDVAFWTMRASSARGTASELPWYITMSSCCPGECVSVLKSI